MPNYVSPTGRVVRVDSAEDAALYRSLGYHEEGAAESQERVGTEEESRYYSRGIERGKAFVEGIGSGATAGITDMIAGPESETAKRALHNSGTRLAGEIVGGFIGAKIPVTPAGAIARAGTSVTKGLGGGLLAKGVGGAVEGSLYGAGAMAASASLSGDPINAEVLGAGVGIGGLIGFGAGAVGGALERSALKRSGKAAGEVIEDLQKKEQIAHLESELSQLDTRLPADRSVVPREHWDRLRHSARDIGDELLEVHKAAKEAVSQVKQAGSFADSVAAAEYRTIPGMGGLAGAVHQIARQVDRQMTAFLSGRGNTDVLRSAAMDFFKEIDEIKAMGWNFPSGPASMGRDLVAGAIDAVEKSKVSGDVASVLRSLPKDPTAITRAQADKLAAAIHSASGLSERTGGLADSVEEFLGSIGTVREGTLPERLYGGFEDLRTASRQARQGARVAKENLPAIKQRRKEIQDQLDELRKPPDDLKHKPHPVWNFTKRLAHYGGAMEGAKLGRMIGGGGYGAAMGAMIGGSAVSTLLGFGPEGGGLAGALLGARGRVRARLNSAIMRWGGAAGRAARRGIPAYTAILGATALSPAPRRTTDLRESVKDRIEEVAALMPTLPNNAYAATGAVADEHPELAAALQEHIVRAISYLHTMAPRNPGTVVVGGKDRWVPSEIKAREYAERWFGVFMPLEAGEEFLSGNASPAVIHALANTHPAYYNELRTAMLNKISDPKVMARLDRHARSQVTWFTGIPMDSSERPEIVEFLQQQLTAPPVTGPVPPEQQASLGGRPPGPAQENLTQAQRLTAR